LDNINIPDMKIYFISGYTKDSKKPKYIKAIVINYLPQQVVEAETKDGQRVMLYKGEYYTK
jgi:hypothetical protein